MVLSMPSLEEFFNKNTLISLSVPHGWKIIKNDLFHLDLSYIDQLQTEDNDFFIVEDLYLFNDVFYASYEFLDLYTVCIYVTSYPQRDENERYIGFEYEVDLVVALKKKTRKEPFIQTWRVSGFNEMYKILNKLLLFVHIKLDKVIEDRQLNEEDIEQYVSNLKAKIPAIYEYSRY